MKDKKRVEHTLEKKMGGKEERKRNMMREKKVSIKEGDEEKYEETEREREKGNREKGRKMTRRRETK